MSETVLKTMSRRFLTQPDKAEGWKRLQRYSGEVSGDPFFLTHDTFIRVTSNTEAENASPGRNFTIKRRTVSEQRQNIQADSGNKEVFDPRAKLKKVGVDKLEKFKEIAYELTFYCKHNQLCVPQSHSVKSMFRVLGIYIFALKVLNA